MQLLYYIGAITLLMGGNIALRLAISEKHNDFDKELLKKGIIKYIFTALGIAMMYCAGMLIPDLTVIEIGGKAMTMIDALNFMALAFIFVYAFKCFQNIKILLGKDNVDLKEVE